MDEHTASAPARRLAGAIEPVAGQVYFAPECHAAYQALGFAASPGDAGGVALPDGPAYFASRGSVMGQVRGEVIAAAFAVFNPDAVIPMTAHAWTLTDADTICRARTDGAVAHLERLLGSTPDGIELVVDALARANEPLRPAGRPLFAGQLSLPLPGTPLGEAWRLADRLREFRGDAHNAAWTSARLDAPEIGLITERYWGLPHRSYVRTRAWTETQLDAAADRLARRGLLVDGDLTPAGRNAREEIEHVTDRACQAAVDAVGTDLDALCGHLESWGATIRAGGGYLPGGPHDLAAASS